ncbi:thymidylate kinase [Rhizoctonia solani AG-3 Rhs1AP]|uniref:dTMP kinase n=1 Tax=Rhizoctonia solani AG-3 Rhs1AP TaxID=1086054 RepID=A0A0A1UMA5_9AGAM|nr:thymidylate kinase [Rhizoctonia solani AG-3 Rhs1AP]
MGRRSSDSRSDSPFLDAYALSQLFWSGSEASSDEVDDILANATMVATTAVTDDDTDNPDENEVDGLIDTFDVDLPDRSLIRISSWLANVTRPDVFDFISDRKVLSPLPINRKRKSSSTNLRGQPPLKAPKLMIDQPIWLDRSGKSTQCERMVARIEGTGKPVKAIKFPGKSIHFAPTNYSLVVSTDRTTEIGKLIDAYLQSKAEVDDHTIHLLFSANRWELASSIKSHLASGTTLVCDRYAYSGLAFSAAKQKPNLSYEWCLSPDIGLPAPDAAFFLEVSPEIAKQRGGYGQERYENEKMQTAVRQTFQRIGKDVQERWEVVDANRTQEQVEEDLWSRIGPLISGQLEDNLKTMWANRIQ